MYCDCPLATVAMSQGRSLQMDGQTVLIPPNGKAQGTVVVPERMRNQLLAPRARSRRARVGFHVMPLRGYAPDQSGILKVSVFNWSPSCSLILHKGDSIALTPLKWVETLPLVQKIPLTADGVYLHMNEDALPKIDGTPFFDPMTMDPEKYMVMEPYDRLELQEYGHLVIRVREQPVIPEHHIGFVSSAVKGLLQNSAQVVYPGSDGDLVVENKVFRPIRIEPGKHIANMTLHDASWLPSYEGSLGKRQGSIIPPLHE